MVHTVCGGVIARVIQLFTGDRGVKALLTGGASQGGPGLVVNPGQVRSQNVAPDLAEKSNTMQYPALNVYCDKIVNSLAVKFATFSGSVQVVAEVRHSQDRLDGLQGALEACTDAVTQALTASRGNWGDGMFYDGSYQAAFGAAKHGGKNFLQTARITFEIGVSRS